MWNRQIEICVNFEGVATDFLVLTSLKKEIRRGRMNEFSFFFVRLATSWPSLSHSSSEARGRNLRSFSREAKGRLSNKGASASDEVTRGRLVLLAGKSVWAFNFWREKHDWHFSDFTCSARDPLEGRKWRRWRRPKRFWELLCPRTRKKLFISGAENLSTMLTDEENCFI